MSDYVQPDLSFVGEKHVVKYRETDGEVVLCSVLPGHSLGLVLSTQAPAAVCTSALSALAGQTQPLDWGTPRPPSCETP